MEWNRYVFVHFRESPMTTQEAVLGAQFLAGWAWRRSCTAAWPRSRLYTVEMQIVLAGVWVATRIYREKKAI